MRRSSVVFFAFATLSLVACKKDKDKDGYKGTDDCDDGDAGIHPGTDEICDGIDNNCDGQVDEGLLLDWYADADGDTYGDPEVVVSACNQPDGYEDNADDCNDGSDLFHPGALEDDCADPSDYNCDGSVGYADADGDGYAACNDCDDTDPAVYSPTTWYIDYDADTYGSALYTSIACTEPIGYTDDFDDCDDLDPEINPETRWYPDADADAYGDINGETQQCAAPQGPDELPEGAPDGIADYDYILDNTDCDDTNAEVNPDTLWFEDADGDGYGYPGTYVGTCEQPEGYAINADDCDDEDADINPAALEVCDGSDNDCDVEIDEDEPWLELTAQGPKTWDEQDRLRRAGQLHPYTLKVGNLRFNYLETPLAIPFAFLGHVYDSRRYGKEADIDLWRRITAGSLVALNSWTNLSFMASVDKAMEVMTMKDQKEAERLGRDLFSFGGTSFVMPNLIRQLDTLFDPTKTRISDLNSMYQQSVPFARREGYPDLDMYGQNVERSEGPLWKRFGHRIIRATERKTRPSP